MAQRSARDSQIFIIGCGISGIGAAQKLLQQGFHNVHIIEATARSGGRIRTGRLGMHRDKSAFKRAYKMNSSVFSIVICLTCEPNTSTLEYGQGSNMMKVHFKVEFRGHIFFFLANVKSDQVITHAVSIHCTSLCFSLFVFCFLLYCLHLAEKPIGCLKGKFHCSSLFYIVCQNSPGLLHSCISHLFFSINSR